MVEYNAKELELVTQETEDMARAERADEQGRAVHEAVLREMVTLANMIADACILRAQDYADVAKAHAMLAEAWVQPRHLQEGLCAIASVARRSGEGVGVSGKVAGSARVVQHHPARCGPPLRHRPTTTGGRRAGG
jgi:hypothetical protein